MYPRDPEPAMPREDGPTGMDGEAGEEHIGSGSAGTGKWIDAIASQIFLVSDSDDAEMEKSQVPAISVVDPAAPLVTQAPLTAGPATSETGAAQMETPHSFVPRGDRVFCSSKIIIYRLLFRFDVVLTTATLHPSALVTELQDILASKSVALFIMADPG
jgi:hypothetical protein